MFLNHAGNRDLNMCVRRFGLIEVGKIVPLTRCSDGIKRKTEMHNSIQSACFLSVSAIWLTTFCFDCHAVSTMVECTPELVAKLALPTKINLLSKILF